MTRAPLRMAAFVLACATGLACDAGSPTPPNVVFILADDLRFDALGSHGNEDVPTPSLDRLAAEGVSFDAFYVASPVCVSSRMNFHTGRHLLQDGIFLQPRARIRRGTETMAGLFRAAGYETAFIGKVHATSDPLELGFEEAPFYVPGMRVGRTVPASVWVERRGPLEIEVTGLEGHETARTVDEAIDWIGRERTAPFFLWLATTAPHYPYVAAPGAETIPATRRPPMLPPGEPFPEAIYTQYYTLVAELDRELGRLFDAIDRPGLRDDTLVVFTSDNGILHGSHGISSKGVWYEEAIRQPLIVRWPGVTRAGTRPPGLASSVDWFVTFRAMLAPAVAARAEAIAATDGATGDRKPGKARSNAKGADGSELDAALEGHDLIGMLRGERSTRDAVFSLAQRRSNEGGGEWTMVRTAQQKFVHFRGLQEEHLYDLSLDPFELAPLPATSPLRTALSARLDAFEQRWESANRRSRRMLDAKAARAVQDAKAARAAD